MNFFGIKSGIPIKIAAVMFMSFAGANSAWAKFYNTGVYAPNQNAIYGQTVTVNGSIMSDVNQAGVFVTIGLHSISSAGVIASTAVYSEAFVNQNFVANKGNGYKITYVVPESIATGKYAVVMKAGSTAGASNYLMASGTTGNYVVAMEGKPVPSGPVTGVTFYNTGVYVTAPSVNAGAAVTVKNGFKATKDVPNTIVKLEIHKVLDSGAIDSAVVAKKEESGVKFIANEGKSYTTSFNIPAGAPSGKYAFTASVADASSGTVYFKMSSVSSSTSFAVNNTTVVVKPKLAAFTRGLNIMDMGMGGYRGTYDKNYTAPKLVAQQALASVGLQTIRISFGWERAQPSLGGPLDKVYMDRLIKILKEGKTAGMKILLDMHNYARYTTVNNEKLVFGAADGPTQAQFADAWAKISNYVKADPDAYSALLGYDLMNEPYSIPAVNGVPGAQVWEQYAQAAVNAIRANGDNAPIHVEGYSFASAIDFKKHHPEPFIKDAKNNIVYHAHVYFDYDVSGSYQRTFEEETALAKKSGYASVGARGIARIKSFTDYCALKKINCFMGEFGWPNTYHVGVQNAANWNSAGEEIMAFMDSVRLSGTMWATGSWLRERHNILNVYGIPGYSTSTFESYSQSQVLERHLGRPEEEAK